MGDLELKTVLGLANHRGAKCYKEEVPIESHGLWLLGEEENA